MSQRGLLLAVAGLLVLGATPFLAGAAEEHPRCDRDGTRIGGLLDVRVRGSIESGAIGSSSAAEEHVFCSVRCAEDWLRRSRARPPEILVRTEPEGRVMPVASAVFVRSLVPASRHSGDLVHAFEDAAQAESHARFFGGVVLEGADRPFSGGRK